MAIVGPELPAHLQTKRKRSNDEGEEGQRPSQIQSKRARSSSSSDEVKPRRVLGPAPPPALLSERPNTKLESEDASNCSDEDDDDFGPSLPPIPSSAAHTSEAQRQQDIENTARAQEAANKPQREEWMLVPPKQDDWSSRVDPTKLRNRKFNTGKGSKAPSQGARDSDALWTETPEQKRQRLEDEVLGIKKPAQLGPETKKDERKEQEAKETRERIRTYEEKNRGESLYKEHKKVGQKEKEDDPSKRAFDKDKDMGLGMKVGHAQKREVLNKAKDFGSRFAGGSYL